MGQWWDSIGKGEQEKLSVKFLEDDEAEIPGFEGASLDDQLSCSAQFNEEVDKLLSSGDGGVSGGGSDNPASDNLSSTQSTGEFETT